MWVIIEWVLVICDQCNLPWTCRCKPAEYTTEHERLIGALRMLRQLTPHTMWPLKIHYTQFIQINTILWLDDCTFGICSENCEMQTTSHQQMSPKHTSCPPCPTHWPRDWIWKAEGKWQRHIFALGRSNCEWLLVHNFALMQLQNLPHIWINTITFSLMQFRIDDSHASLSFVGG